MSDTAIAVVGVGCRFPDAWTPEEFWANIDNGVVSMRPLSDAVLRQSGVDESTLRADDYVKVGALLPGAADFAAEFFGYTPREAELIDPQQRVFLEVAWEALERAGHSASTDRGTVGVFAGTGAGPYTAALFAAKARTDGVAAAVGDLDLTLGGEVDFLPSRTAYKLGLRGPAVSVQTGCSSSLYALHYASLSLLAGECDIAIAGGSAVQEPLLGYRYKPGRALSKDGQCRSFDHGSSGTYHGSGVGVLVLRLLSDALADGDTVLAVLHGSAVGNDGSDKLGYVAPSAAGITRVVGKALQVSGVRGDQVRYVEAHGTATPLGDQVELAALTDALRQTTDATGFCRLGSVMSTIGHTGPTAGIAGFIKAVNIARTGVLPPHPSFERPREPGVLAESPFTISTEPGRTEDDCFVVVNSVGMGGANVCAVLGPPPAPTRPPADEWMYGEPALLAPEFYNSAYRPRLVAVDDLSIPESSSPRVWEVLRELGLADLVTVVNADLRECDRHFPADFTPIHLAWVDAWECLYFFDNFWDLIDPDGGLVVMHYLMTSPEGEAFLRYLSAQQERRPGEFEVVNLLEPHKLSQNSLTILRRTSGVVPRKYAKPGARMDYGERLCSQAEGQAMAHAARSGS